MDSPKHYVQNSKELSGKKHNREESWKWKKSTEIDTSGDNEAGESHSQQKWCLSTQNIDVHKSMYGKFLKTEGCIYEKQKVPKWSEEKESRQRCCRKLTRPLKPSSSVKVVIEN